MVAFVLACLLRHIEQDMNNYMDPRSTQLNDHSLAFSALQSRRVAYSLEIAELQEVGFPAECSHGNGCSLCYCGKGNWLLVRDNS
jgi:hypothetical protein